MKSELNLLLERSSVKSHVYKWIIKRNTCLCIATLGTTEPAPTLVQAFTVTSNVVNMCLQTASKSDSPVLSTSLADFPARKRVNFCSTPSGLQSWRRRDVMAWTFGGTLMLCRGAGPLSHVHQIWRPCSGTTTSFFGRERSETLWTSKLSIRGCAKHWCPIGKTDMGTRQQDLSRQNLNTEHLFSYFETRKQTKGKN